MSRNIVIFSDGTGQRSGVFFDENRSNIYKLYRATTCGPDSKVNPSLQLTFTTLALVRNRSTAIFLPVLQPSP